MGDQGDTVDPLEVASAQGAQAPIGRPESEKMLSTLVKLRKALRSRFTRKVNEMDAALKHVVDRSTRHEVVTCHWDAIEDIYEQIKVQNDKLTPLINECTPDQFDAAMERVFAYEDMYHKALRTLKSTARADSLPNINTAGVAQVQIPAQVPAQPTYLPASKPYRLPKFNGDFKKFREWWQLFKVHVDSKKMDSIEKFTMLKEALTDIPASDVAHLEFTADQYQAAVDIIEKKYGCPREAEREHVQELRRICLATDLRSNDKLSTFVSSLSQNVKALLSLGNTYESLSLMVTPGVLNCLPGIMRKDFNRLCYERTAEAKKGSELELLLEFLEKEVAINRASRPLDFQNQASSSSFKNRDSSRSNESRSHNSDRKNWKSRQERHGGSQTFLTSSSSVDHSCVFCDSSRHESRDCKKSLSFEERKELCETNNACFKCLRRNHYAKKCRSRNIRCAKCKKSHYEIMCNSQNKPEQSVTSFSASTVSKSELGGSISQTFFQTGYAWVNSSNGRKISRFFVDSGAERSYVTQQLADALQLEPAGTEYLAMLTIGGEVSKYKKYNIYNIGLQSRFNNGDAITLSAIGIPEIAKGNFPVMEQSWGLEPLADKVERAPRKEIDILIGLDVIGKIKIGEERVFENQFVATNTIFGWVLAGKKDQQAGAQATSHSLVTANLYQPGTNIKSSKILALTTLCSASDLAQRASGSLPSAENENGVREARTESDLQFLWSTEFLGVESKSEDTSGSANVELEEFIQNNLRRLQNGSYMVSLPFKSNLRSLGDNENIALGSLKRFLAKAKNKKELLDSVDEELARYIEKGYAELATPKKPGELVHYLPILPVVKHNASEGTSKVRVVKDAGARRKDEAALNDVLYQGPNLLPDILKVLLRFRKDRIAIVSDIEKAFLQYKINPEHRTFLRFFWRLGVSKDPKAPIQEFWSTVLDFGIISSPFIHCAGMKLHMRNLKKEFPLKAELLDDADNHYYMDDFVMSASQISEGVEIFKFMFSAFRAGGFRLRKWATNSAELGRSMEACKEDSELQIVFDQSDFKFLGIAWDQSADQLWIPVNSAIETFETNSPTKRTLLRGIARVFDPLGFISPITVKAKVLIQSLWKRGSSWDEALTADSLDAYKELAQMIRKADDIRVDRYLFQTSAKSARELHAFCDASMSAYGGVVYIREFSSQGPPRIRFVASKARVAPIKSEFSIHRLELISAVVLTRLVDSIKKHLNCHFDAVCYWSDNSPTLHWIKDSPDRWKAFVANRIREIQSLSSPADWRYVASADNPADLLSRAVDITAGDSRQKWLNGPEWLLTPGRPIISHQLNEFFDREERIEREKKSLNCLTVRMANPAREVVLDGSRLSSWTIFVNSTARIFRWLSNVRNPSDRIPYSSPVRTIESLNATDRTLKLIQLTHFKDEVTSQCKDLSKESRLFKLTPFVDSNGLLRCRSRLEASEELSYDEMYPIILPGEAHAVRLLIRFFHERRCFHVGGVAATLNRLRSKFYILSARRAVKSVLRDCKVCMKFRVEAAKEPIPPLPDFRLDTAPPFSVCGCDFAGPISYRSSEGGLKKSYICLFVCTVTRAVHLELVPDLTTFEFLLSLRKFINRFGSTVKIISDNGLTFKRAAKELKYIYEHIDTPEVQQHLANAEIVWEFITPRAPWQGGFYERLVQTIKRPLRKILGKNVISFRELETVLSDIESMVNRRPLTSVQVDPNEISALSPADLLFGYKARISLPRLRANPLNREAAGSIVYSERWRHQQSMVASFQKRFKVEYLQYLRSAHIREPVQRRSLQVGDVCLLKDSDPSRAHWPLCRILSLSGGGRTDRLKRSCLIKTATGQVFNRPIQLLFPLEV